jgi:hypothetical protein
MSLAECLLRLPMGLPPTGFYLLVIYKSQISTVHTKYNNQTFYLQ